MSDFLDFVIEVMAIGVAVVGVIIFSPILIPLYILYLLLGEPKGREHHGM